MHRLPQDFKQTLTARELRLAGQRYPRDEVGIRLARAWRERSGADLFVYSEGRENIELDQSEFLVDGEVAFTLTEEYMEGWTDLHGEEAEAAAQRVLQTLTA